MLSGGLRGRDRRVGDVATELGDPTDGVALVETVAHHPAADDGSRAPDPAPAVHVGEAASLDLGVDIVEDPRHARDGGRPEVDDRMRGARRAGTEKPRVRLERVGRMREIDEERHPVAGECADSARGLVGVGRPGVLTGEEAVGDAVAVADGDVHVHGAAYASRVDADPVELRVLGCLLEKQRTTPDQYPFSLNALRLACNQTTNRDPVVSYDEGEIHEALQRLARRGWTRLASGAGSRAAKYRQLFDEALGLDADEVAILCVLMLRGPQTPGELNQRTGRLHAFAGLDEIHETLDGLAGRGLVERLERRPGQKEERYRHLLGAEQQGTGAGADMSGPSDAPTEGQAPVAGSALESRVAALEEEVARLREAVAGLTHGGAGAV